MSFPLLEPLAVSTQRPLLSSIGSYRIDAELAVGGMAVLYRGLQESLGRPVAIKALRSELLSPLVSPLPPAASQKLDSDEPDWIARFIREAHLLASLQHENLVHIYDLVDQRPAGGSLFIVMELCEGIDLLDLLTRTVKLPADVAVLFALGAAKALAHIHERGILHRDLKPANLLLTKSGIVKLVDFGTAWDPTNVDDLSGRQVGLGTPSYMSPEQALGEPLDHRSDQFSLGVVIYQMLAGQKPFLGEDPQAVMREIVRANPPSLRRLNRTTPTALLRIVERCLRRRPPARYASTGELVQALELVARRLIGPVNERARLVQFLLDEALISEAEAAIVLRPWGIEHQLPQALQRRAIRPRWLRRIFTSIFARPVH